MAFSSITSRGQTNSQPPGAKVFSFRFVSDHPLTYQIKTTLENTMHLKSGEETRTTTTKTELSYNARLTGAGEPSNSVTTVHFEPSDYFGETEVRGPAGHFTSTVSNLDVKAFQNGILTIDTRRDIGIAQAKGMKAEAAWMLLSGYMDFDKSGKTKAFHGDLPFVDFWDRLNETQISLFDIAFPERPLAVGEFWEETIPLKTLNDVKLDEVLVYTNTFTREPDGFVGDRPVAVFSVAGPLRAHDLLGHIEQGGQSSQINLSSLERHTTGTFRFDPKAGILIESDVTGNATVAMATLVQGRPLSSRMELHIETQLRLLPDDTGNK